MKKRFAIVVLGLLATSGYFIGARPTSASAQSQPMARCQISVPQAWGDYVGSSETYGLTFKDSSGTLRFVRQLPCGFESTPTISVEVRRN
jgi:hypothetical protein